jgi:hypothetical protein
MLKPAKVTPNDFLIDLGYSNGYTAISVVKPGTSAPGIEYNPNLIKLSF